MLLQLLLHTNRCITAASAAVAAHAAACCLLLQVFIEAYPVVANELDYTALELQRFLPGALVRCNNGLHLVSDPIRRPQDIWRCLVAPVGVSQSRLFLMGC